MKESELRQLLILKVAYILFPKNEQLQGLYEKYFGAKHVDINIIKDALINYENLVIVEQFEIILKNLISGLLDAVNDSENITHNNLKSVVEGILVNEYRKELMYYTSSLPDEVCVYDEQLEKMIDKEVSSERRIWIKSEIGAKSSAKIKTKTDTTVAIAKEVFPVTFNLSKSIKKKQKNLDNKKK